MGLPKQILPIFSLTIPSTGKKIQYRQFTVREEKMMTQAKESDNIDTIVNSVKEVIAACVKDPIEIDSLALFDVEYIITKIRAKSVGETIDLNMACEKDPDHPRIPVRVDLDKIEVTKPEGHTKNIELYEGSGVTMRYPTLSDLSELENKTMGDAIAMFIESVYTPDEVFYSREQTQEDMIEYVESLTEKQFNKIDESFFKTMPVFQHEMVYTCPECNHTHKKYIKGLASFFA